ncbi:Uncharacterised protein [Candidatus Tiddalikarchaeum anstoanum]|nr:Uncharacterised protein [Candidatus Tiddalikarchaeum anstoanum]
MKQKSPFGKLRPVRNSGSNAVLKNLPTYENIISYFVQPANKSVGNDAVSYGFTSSNFVARSNNSVGCAAIADDILSKYVYLHQMKFSAKNSKYFINAKIINEVISRGSYYEIVGYSYYNPFKGWSIVKDSDLTPGSIKVEKLDLGFLEEVLSNFATHKKFQQRTDNKF